MNNYLKALGMACLALHLSGCGKSILDNDDARCPFADRGGCQSMEMVNRMVQEKRYTPDGNFVQQANSRAPTATYK